MEQTAERTILHLAMRDGTPVFLHPLLKSGESFRLQGSTALRGLYGSEPRVESLAILRSDLYRRVESDVRDWINDTRFIPRFLIAAGVFAVAFLFMSLVIRDPIPIIDELLISSAAAVATFIFVGRRFEQTQTAAERRVALRTQIDRVVFNEDLGVADLERLLHFCERVDWGVGPHQWTGVDEAREAWQQHAPLLQEVLTYLRVLLATPEYRRVERQLRKKGADAPALRSGAHSPTVPALIALHTMLRVALP